jgi:DNA-directed RNA polymerase alpha subunit
MSTPKLVKKYEDGGKLIFKIQNMHVSLANALRRTILSDIPVIVIRTENTKINQCAIVANTSRFHNEIVKQRLSSIPIHSTDKDFPTKHILEIDVKNDSDHEMRWVTTKDFKIKDKQNGMYLDDAAVRAIFPPNAITNQYIDFLRLRPSIGPTIPGEQIKLSAEFSVSSAKTNGMFNVVSTCSFYNVIDTIAKDEAWGEHMLKLKNENKTAEEIQFEKKNFECLDAYRYFKKDSNGDPNEFEFFIQSIGVYTNEEILHLACMELKRKCRELIEDIESHSIPICPSSETKEMGYGSVIASTMANSWDVLLLKDDYTMGLMIERILYTEFYEKTEEMTFVGFKKYHPHDGYSVIRVAYSSDNMLPMLNTQLIHSIKIALNWLEAISPSSKSSQSSSQSSQTSKSLSKGSS